MKKTLNKLRDFNIITSLTIESGREINFNPNTISVTVTKDKCEQYPDGLKKLQELLRNEKSIEWSLHLTC